MRPVDGRSRMQGLSRNLCKSSETHRAPPPQHPTPPIRMRQRPRPRPSRTAHPLPAHSKQNSPHEPVVLVFPAKPRRPPATARTPKLTQTAGAPLAPPPCLHLWPNTPSRPLSPPAPGDSAPSPPRAVGWGFTPPPPKQQNGGPPPRTAAPFSSCDRPGQPLTTSAPWASGRTPPAR